MKTIPSQRPLSAFSYRRWYIRSAGVIIIRIGTEVIRQLGDLDRQNFLSDEGPETDVARDDDAVIEYCAATMAEDCANFPVATRPQNRVSSSSIK